MTGNFQDTQLGNFPNTQTFGEFPKCLGFRENSFINHELSFYFNKTQFILLNLDQG